MDEEREYALACQYHSQHETRMFKQLDEIDWASMNHAYGSAEDVPQLIRDLADEDEETRNDAFFTAYGNIFHQGSRYEATAPAVPFLLEVLEQPEYADHAELLYLLAHLVMGYSQAYMPFGFADEIAGMREELAALRARPDAERAEDEKDSLGWGTDEDWLGWIVGITEEVRKGVPRYVRLLGADDPRVRVAAAFLMSWLPEDVELCGPALWEAASNDPDDVVRANALIALTLAADDEFFAEYVPEVTGWLSDSEPIVQFATAVALGTRCPEDAPDAIVQILLDAVARSGEQEHGDDDDDATAEADADEDADGDDWWIAWHDGDYGAYASEVLAFACADDPSRVVNAVAQALQGMHTRQAVNATGTVLALIFPRGFEGESAADLEPTQREFLQKLSEVRNPWYLGEAQYADFSLIMSDFGLPSSIDELANFLG